MKEYLSSVFSLVVMYDSITSNISLLYPINLLFKPFSFTDFKSNGLINPNRVVQYMQAITGYHFPLQ